MRTILNIIENRCNLYQTIYPIYIGVEVYVTHTQRERERERDRERESKEDEACSWLNITSRRILLDHCCIAFFTLLILSENLHIHCPVSPSQPVAADGETAAEQTVTPSSGFHSSHRHSGSRMDAVISFHSIGRNKNKQSTLNWWRATSLLTGEIRLGPESGDLWEPEFFLEPKPLCFDKNLVAANQVD